MSGFNKYIVSVTSLPAALKVFSSLGAKTERLFPFISAVGVRVRESELKSLNGLLCVKSIHADCLVRAAGESGKDVKISFPAAEFKKRADGAEKTTVAVIDTGIAFHPDLALFPSRVVAFVDLIGGRKIPYDDNGHGTAVSGVLCGSGLMRGKYLSRAHRSVRIAVLKALTSKGEGTAFDILTAMQWVYSNKLVYNIRVVNMSLGSSPQGQNDPLCLGAKALADNGIAVIASAGNGALEGEGVLSPGISPFVITAGGLDGDKEAAFSPHSRDKPDVYAPATDITVPTTDGGYTTLSGTSLAAPAVSALAADILSLYPSLSPFALKAILISKTKKHAPL